MGTNDPSVKPVKHLTSGEGGGGRWEVGRVGGVQRQPSHGVVSYLGSVANLAEVAVDIQVKSLQE